jgi:tetratricopeptide (TPR) repeat protein
MQGISPRLSRDSFSCAGQRIDGIKIMGLFDLFKGKDPVQHEQEGDRYFSVSAFGQAKLEYGAALGKRRKDFPGDTGIPRLEDKIVRCREALAREHKKRADDLVANGYFEEAQEFYALALDLTQDGELARAVEDCRQNIECRQSEIYRVEQADADEPEEDIGEPSIPESDDEYLTALFNTLPDDVREAYLGYGPSFQSGYAALNRGQFDIAAKELSRALEEHPAPESFIRLELATALLNLKRFDEARALLEEFIACHAEEFSAYRMLCEIYWEAGDFERPQALLDSLSDDQRESLEYCLLRGEALFRAGKRGQAQSFYQDFLRDYGWNTDIARVLADVYEADGELQKAYELYGKILGQCGSCGVRIDPLIKRKYADLSMATGKRNEKILEIYLSLAGQDPANAAGYYQKVSQIYDALGHEKESLRFRLLALGQESDRSPEES